MTVAKLTTASAVLFVAAAIACAPAVADPPPWAKGKGHGKGRGHQDQAARVHVQEHFTDQHRVVVREYYQDQFRRGHCPPGLAKKNNGCMPPGQAKKWRIGRPLPPNVVYYEVPQPVLVQLGAPPAGYKYVRVASDILMIAIGSVIVAAAIEDLGRS